jgi:hypothetical protein
MNLASPPLRQRPRGEEGELREGGEPPADESGRGVGRAVVDHPHPGTGALREETVQAGEDVLLFVPHREEDRHLALIAPRSRAGLREGRSVTAGEGGADGEGQQARRGEARKEMKKGQGRVPGAGREKIRPAPRLLRI